jgi:hypothetical protein
MVRRGTGPVDIAYLVTLTTLLWFVGIGAFLIAQAWRRPDPGVA